MLRRTLGCVAVTDQGEHHGQAGCGGQPPGCALDRGAGTGPCGGRSVTTVAEVDALADAVPPRYWAMVLLAAWCSLRFGELAALTANG